MEERETSTSGGKRSALCTFLLTVQKSWTSGFIAHCHGGTAHVMADRFPQRSLLPIPPLDKGSNKDSGNEIGNIATPLVWMLQCSPSQVAPSVSVRLPSVDNLPVPSPM